MNQFDKMRAKLGRPRIVSYRYGDTVISRVAMGPQEAGRLGGLRLKGRKRSREHQDKINETNRKIWSDLEKRKRHSETRKVALSTPEYRDKRSKISLRLWQDPKYVASQMRARNRNQQNKLEKSFEHFLDKHFPGCWKFVGDGSLIIGNLCPDFTHTSMKHLLIDLFGSYWHEPQDEEYRIGYFSKRGFKLLVVWEEELSNRSSVYNKVKNFTDLNRDNLI